MCTLFTQFVGLNNVYEALFKICNTDTNLYDFLYKKKEKNLPQLDIMFPFIDK